MNCIRTLLVVLACAGIAAISASPVNSAAEPSGETVYETHCAKCHAGGFGSFFSGAPKVGKQKAWRELLPKGVEKLTTNTLTGVGDMEPRGKCAECTDDEIRAAVEYMVEESQ